VSTASTSLTQQDRGILEGRNFAHLATVSDDGWPQSTAVWVDVEDGLILVNSAEGRRKVANVRRDPRVSLSLTDGNDPYRMLAIRGRVVEVTNEGARQHIDKMAHKYRGRDRYDAPPGQVRVLLKIRPERVYRYGY
jgi:PPOX class probable F420-dependent enzyme